MQKSLEDLIKEINQNKIVIPNFQREYDWSEKDVRYLIASYFFKLKLGSLLFFNYKDRKNKGENFLPYLTFWNVSAVITDHSKAKTDSDYLNYVIDGQQRLTSSIIAFSNLYTKKESNSISRKFKRKFYIRVESDDDLFGIKNMQFKPPQIDEIDYDEFVENKIGYVNSTQMIPPISKNDEDKTVFNIPLEKLYDPDNNHDDLHSHIKYIGNTRRQQIRNENDFTDDELNKLNDNKDKWVHHFVNYLSSVIRYKLPIIEVKDNLIEAIKSYEIINITGKQLSELDILSANYSSHCNSEQNQRLYDVLRKSFKATYNIHPSIDKYKIENNTLKTWGTETNNKIEWNFMDYLVGNNKEIPNRVIDQFMKLLMYSELKKQNDDERYNNLSFYKTSELIKMKGDIIKRNIEEATESIKWASQFLQLRCGLRSINNLNYFWQLFVLAATWIEFQEFSEDKLDFLEGWYFLSRFSGRYRIDQNKHALKDLTMIVKHFNKNPDGLSILQDQLYEIKYDNQTEDIPNKLLKKKVLMAQSILEPYEKMTDIICEFGVRKGYTTTFLFDDEKKYFISTLTEPFMRDSKYRLDKHHIYPLSKSKQASNHQVRRDDLENLYNSPLNKVYITSAENRFISSRDIKDYYDDLGYTFTDENAIKSMNDSDLKNDYERLNEALEKRYKDLFKKVYSDIEKLLDINGSL